MRTSTCKRNVNGLCAVARSGILKMTDRATDNHDFDGDSNGTSITVIRP